MTTLRRRQRQLRTPSLSARLTQLADNLEQLVRECGKTNDPSVALIREAAKVCDERAKNKGRVVNSKEHEAVVRRALTWYRKDGGRVGVVISDRYGNALARACSALLNKGEYVRTRDR